MRFLERQFLLAVLASLATFAHGDSVVPRTLNYQGTLSSGGQPVNVATDITVRLYDQPAGGNLVYQEAHPGVAVANGVYSFVIGALTPLDPAIFAGALFLSVQAGSDAEMTPRQPLATVPYAFRAETAGSIAGVTTAQRNAIVSPASGAMVFCSDCGPYGEPQFYGDSGWRKFDGSSPSGTGTVTMTIDQLFPTTNAAPGPGGIGQSFLVGPIGGKIEKVVTSALGGAPGISLAGIYLRIRRYVNDIESTSISPTHALTGEIIATSSVTPVILNFDFGPSYPTAEYVFVNGPYLEANTKYVIEFVRNQQVSGYVKIFAPYADGQAYDIDGINHEYPRDFPFRLFLRQYP